MVASLRDGRPCLSALISSCFTSGHASGTQVRVRLVCVDQELEADVREEKLSYSIT